MNVSPVECFYHGPKDNICCSPKRWWKMKISGEVFGIYESSVHTDVESPGGPSEEERRHREDSSGYE